MRFKTQFRRGLAACLSLLAPIAATAQDNPNTILVLDGSGSMWGQIEGVAKITIAQQVVGDLLDGFPTDQNLGLTVYGHREKGNCADIETVVSPGAGTMNAIRNAVNGIKPKGKTPMTDAVIAAAQALRYTEEKATVILVSDGIETCNPDPCAAAAALEEAGVDFTAHVVGFDVTDPNALAQMQCIADGTGGKFLKASDAAELSQALTTVAAAPEPEPEPVAVPITFEARLDAEDGPLVDGPVFWTLSPLPENVGAEEEGNQISFDMLPGSYNVTAYWAAGEAEVTQQFIVADSPRTIIAVFEAPAQTATITAPDTAVAGSTIEIAWDGPNEKDDYVGIGRVGTTGAALWQNYVYTREGSPNKLLVPTTPGDYVITYFLGQGREAIGSTPITVTEVQASITAPDSATAGSTIEIAWTGPDYRDDYIGIGLVGSTGAALWQNYVYTREGSPTKLLVPQTPGDYEITYFLGQDRQPLLTVPITVTDVQASITAPESAAAGSTIELSWTGPDYKDDYIGIGRADAERGDRWENYVHTREGSPTKLLIPETPGDYVITYFLSQGREPLVSVPISVTEVQASITAPQTVIAGETIEISWTGPDYKDDYIGIGRADAERGDRWENYTQTREGSPMKLRIPEKPGDYVITYFLNQGREPLVSVPITVADVEATLTAPASAVAGSTIEVAWTGPDYKDDYIGVGRADAERGDRWENYTYTREGSKLKLLVPERAGDYLITYFMNQDRRPVVQIPLTVTPVSATLTAPASAAAGSTIEVGWTGPNYKDDYIGIGKATAERGDRWRSYTYTRDGNPTKLKLPDEPGDYIIRYFMNQDRTPIAEVRIQLQ